MTASQRGIVFASEAMAVPYKEVADFEVAAIVLNWFNGD
jgi:hypothetical protein